MQRHVNLVRCSWALQINHAGGRQGKGNASHPSTTLSFSSPSSLFLSAHLFDLTWLSFHTSWEWKLLFPPQISRDKRSLLFNQSPPRLSEPCWGRHIDNRPVIFSELWYHSLTSQAHSDCEILSQWKDNELSWSSGISQKTSCMLRLCQTDTTRVYPAFQSKNVNLIWAACVFFTPALHSFCSTLCVIGLLDIHSFHHLIQNNNFTVSKLNYLLPQQTQMP